MNAHASAKWGVLTGFTQMIGLRIMKNSSVLIKYLPESCAEKVHDWLLRHNCILRITKARASKLGDYRPPNKGLPHRISVNFDLNQHEFLITLIHEMAHLLCWEKYKGRVKPHGMEWKLICYNLTSNFCESNVFPEDIHQALTEFFHTATSYRRGNELLRRTLRNHDPDSGNLTIEDIAEGSTFVYQQRSFRKLNKARRRYKCICLNNNRLYSFSPLARVVPANSSDFH